MIPFTQYLRPEGRRKMVEITRPADVEETAQRFINAGGRYEIEVLTTGEISMTAVMRVSGEERDVEIEVCDNGPPVPIAVDKLVLASVAHVR